MRLELSFKGFGEGYVSRIHRGIRWTHIVISRGQKLTTTVYLQDPKGHMCCVTHCIPWEE